MKNYYEILNISRYSSQDDIKKAYLKLIKKYHPDIYKGDKLFAEKQTAIITEAYTTLKNPELKAKYDHKIFGASTTVQHSNQSKKTTTKTEPTKNKTTNEKQSNEPTFFEKMKNSFKKTNQNIKNKISNWKQKRKQKKQDKLNNKAKENSQNVEKTQKNSTNTNKQQAKDPAKKQRLVLDLAIISLLILLFLLLFFPLQ